MGMADWPQVSALLVVGLLLVAWLGLKLWKCFQRWDRRDPLALKKLTLAINVLALMAGTTAIIRLHLQAKRSPQPTTPTYQVVATSGSLQSTHDAVSPMLENQQPVQPDGDDAEAPEPPCDQRNECPSVEPSSQGERLTNPYGYESSLQWQGLYRVYSIFVANA